MEIDLSLGMPPGADETTILLDMGDRRDSGEVLCEFMKKAKTIIPDLELQDFGIKVDVSDVLVQESFPEKGYIRMEVKWEGEAQAKISILQFMGMQISDEEAEKIFGKIITLGNSAFSRNEKGDAVLFSDNAFDDIRLTGHHYDSVTIVKKNRSNGNGNEVIVALKDRLEGDKRIFFVDITDVNGTNEGKMLGEYLAEFGSDYVVGYYSIRDGNGKKRNIRKKNAINRLLSVFS